MIFDPFDASPAPKRRKWEPPKGKGTAKTHAQNRRALRKKLRDQGWPEEAIEKHVAHLAAQQREARAATKAAAEKQARREADFYASDARRFDDSKHRPAVVDPLMTGPARATGKTAKAVKRAKATTKYEYDRMGPP